MEGTNQDSDTVTFRIKKTYLHVVLAIVIGFGGGFGIAKVFFSPTSADETLSNPEQSSPPQAGTVAPAPTGVAPPQDPVVEISVEGRPFLGQEDAAVTVVEFTDYQCSFCRRYFLETASQLLSQNVEKIKYVVLNFPLSSIHPQAQEAAEAAECASDQEKFWEYHDLLFENQSALDTASLKDYAADLSMDTEVFNTCLDSGAKTEQVQNDFQVGVSAGVQGTPTFAINNQLLVGAQPLDAFQARIDAALTE